MGSSRFILDANIFIAYYLESDTCHERAVCILDVLPKSEALIPYCVIQEVCTVLTYRAGKSAALQFLEDIEKAQDVKIINNDVSSEIAYFKTRSEKLSFTDLVLLKLSKEWSAELITFDEQLLKLYKKVKKT